jgi:hypothetical protein
MSRRLVISLVASALALGSLAGCGKMKVDCEKLCKKTYGECGGELRVVKARLDRASLEELQRNPAKLEKLQKSLAQEQETCRTRCKEKKGYGSDAGKFNDCLRKHSDCRGYAACIKELVN